MRNLELYYHADRPFKQFKSVQHFCVNSLENTVYIYDDGVIFCLSQNEDTLEVLNVKEHCSNELNSKVVAMVYNSALGAVCLGTEQGELLAVGWSAKPSVEVVGCVPQGLHCLQWSPDEEVLLLVTGGDLVIAMTLDFDPLWEQPLHQEAFGERAPITVGWGSKQTQFHGSEGKTAAQRTAPAAADKPSPKDDGSVRVSWRGDGALVAVSAVTPQSGVRCIRIFSREGVLQATGEAVAGLEMGLAWRPTGNLIASTQVLPNKYQVVFFEKNGLRHGEFTLPFAPGAGCVRQLAWNADSDVLSVWYEDADSAHLLLCTVGNYHWYVKQSFCFPLKRRLLACAWDPEDTLKLHLVLKTQSGAVRYTVCEWVWVVNCSSAYAQPNRAEVAVIDSNQVLLTAFAEKVVPPPMCAVQRMLPGYVNQVVFGPPARPSDLCAILSDGRICLLEGSDRDIRWVRRVRLALQGEEEEREEVMLHHWVWLRDRLLLAVATLGLTSQLVHLHFDGQEDDTVLEAKLVEVCLKGSIVSLSPVPVAGGQGESSGDVVVQTTTGHVLLLQLGLGQQHILRPLHSNPERLLRVHALPLPSSAATHYARPPCVVGLSRRCRLFVEGKEVASGVTSMLLLPPSCLLLTTSAHKLLCLQLQMDEQEGLTGMDLSEAISRRVERGSRLVAAGGSSGARVVLQMPRGNLETITPRPLILEQAARDLDAGRFADVLELFRKQRINLNLLVDHNPEMFLCKAEEFVRNVRNPTWLSLLAVELLEEDVTKTAYADAYRKRPRPATLPWEEGGKRAVVCARLCEAMQVVSSELPQAAAALLVPTLSALASGGGEGDLGLQAALQALREAPARGLSLDEGLRHLLTLCDALRLFRAALALYDLPLAAKVAARSNRDPKEYLPFLNELRRLDEAYRCYRVDAHLNRWDSALSHLARCPERLDEFLSVMQEHNLYGHALTLFTRGDQQYMKVAALYGEYLLKERKLEEAIVMLRRAEHKEAALEACRLAGDWQQALVLLDELQYASERRTEHLRGVSAVLLQQRRFQEAAHLLHRHCASTEEAVSALSQGRHWAEAQQVAAEAPCSDLTAQVQGGIVEHWEQLQAEVASSSSTYSSHLQRLRIVRANKLSAPPEEREAEGGTESDLYSDSSSTSGSGSGSGSFQSGRSGSRSGRSTRSGKNRRKQERKLLSLKEGAPLEDLALLRAMHQITTTCFALRKEVRQLCLALVGIGRDTEAASLQRALGVALQLMEDSRAEVWPPELSSPNLQSGEERYGPEATVNTILSGSQQVKVLVQNCELLEPQFRIPPQVQDHINWKLSILNT